jgi:hypothetical protein
MDSTTATTGDNEQETSEPTRSDRIDITQGGITTATADAIDVQQGGIVRATATDIAVTNGGIVLAQGDSVSLDRGFAVGTVGGETRVVQSAANIVGGRDAMIDQSLVMSLLAEKVTIRQPSVIGVLIANRVEGTVRPILDWRGALAFGAAFAVIARLLRRR